jgi:Antitoxin of toxin-antitoxin stability system
MDEAASTHQPILIKGKRHNAVLVSEEDWQAIQETLFLMSVPGMGQSIKEGMTSRWNAVLPIPAGDVVIGFYPAGTERRQKITGGKSSLTD